MQARVRARANIALVKYWGKAAADLNIPAVGSISITLDALWSETSVDFQPGLAADRLQLDGAEQTEQQLARVTACLDMLRRRAGVTTRAAVVSRNNFPTGAGLASSASGFAALVGAAAAALDLDMPPRELSIIARQGSGSAARSIFGGFVEMHAGRADDSGASFAEPLLDAAAWPLRVAIAVTTKAPKAVGSGAGMQRSASSSPYYAAWVASHADDMAAAREAIAARDVERLAEVAEHSCLKMHAAAMAGRPPLIYWNAATLDCIRAVRELRWAGAPVFFTIDAGPQLKAISEPAAAATVAAALQQVPGVVELLASGLGPGIEAV